MVASISARSLAHLLNSTHGDEATVAASQLVSEQDPDSALTIGTQPADATAETLQLKYSLASGRDAAVLGLESLTRTLRALGATRVCVCLVQGTRQFALVFVTEDATELIGALVVTPPMGEPADGSQAPAAT